MGKVQFSLPLLGDPPVHYLVLKGSTSEANIRIEYAFAAQDLHRMTSDEIRQFARIIGLRLDWL